MSGKDGVKFSVKGLDQLIKALKVKPPRARVGILGDHNSRNDNKAKSPTNAEIGAAHEFGTSKLPQRSFLRVPIADHLNSQIENSGLLDKDVMLQVIKSGTLTPWITKVAVIAHSIVLGAFDSGGYGKWRPSNMTNKENKQTLVETHQLRDSITYEVKE